MRALDTKTITKLSILIAITVLMTTIISIPIVGGNGYVNLGDMVIFVTAMLLNRKSAFIVGGLGSFLADMILGYGIYGPASFIIKGLEGFIAGTLLKKGIGKKYPLFATLIAGIWMAFGYYLFETILYGAKGALASIPANLIQGALGAVVSVIVFKALKKTKIEIEN